MHVVSAVSSASSHGILNLPVSLPANSNLGQAASLKSLKEHIGLPDKQTGVWGFKGREQQTLKINVRVILRVTAGCVVPDNGH